MKQTAVFHLTLADTILLATLVLVAPAYSYYAGRRIAAGAVGNRSKAYLRTTLSWWLLSAAMLAVWLRFGRPLSSLGLRFPLDGRSLVGIAVFALVLAIGLRQQMVLARLGGEKLQGIRRAFGATSAVLPRTEPEYRAFLVVAITAGVCEELLFRGYFFAVTAPYLTLLGSMFAGAIVFGLGHSYQGAAGIAKTAVAGAFFGAVYVITGSLFWPMLLHALVDIQGGMIGYRLLREGSS